MERRLIMGTISGLVITLLLTGVLITPGISAAYAEKDDKKNDGDHDQDDKDNKCKNHKYDGQCDRVKPDVEITNPDERHTRLSGGTQQVIVSGTATDKGSGIKQVSVSVDGKKYNPLTLNGDQWSFTTTLKKGGHLVIVKATDNANNIKRSLVTFLITK